MAKRLFASVVMLNMLCMALAVAEEASIGYVKTVEGDAQLVVAGKSIKAQPGSALQTGYTLKTSKNSSMGVTLQDNTVLSIGPDTELTLDEYLYAPTKGDLKLNASMAKGTLQYISGIIAKLRPEAVSVKTPTGNIGVRGTHFLVKVDESGK